MAFSYSVLYAEGLIIATIPAHTIADRKEHPHGKAKLWKKSLYAIKEGVIHYPHTFL